MEYLSDLAMVVTIDHKVTTDGKFYMMGAQVDFQLSDHITTKSP